MDFTLDRVVRIFILSIATAFIPFLILSYMWGGYHNVSIRVTAVIFIVNTLPCIIINMLYHKYYSIKEWLSSFYFFITFFLSFAAINNIFPFFCGYYDKRHKTALWQLF